MEKTYSQKVAKALEIVNYFLIVPALFGLLAATVLIFSGSLYVFLFGLFIYGFSAIGFTLFRCYYKHARGSFSAAALPKLWIVSTAYNLFLMAITLLIVYADSDKNGVENRLTYLPAIAVYSLTAYFSLRAWTFDARKD